MDKKPLDENEIKCFYCGSRVCVSHAEQFNKYLCEDCLDDCRQDALSGAER
jgi:hypothetical protein